MDRRILQKTVIHGSDSECACAQAILELDDRLTTQGERLAEVEKAREEEEQNRDMSEDELLSTMGAEVWTRQWFATVEKHPEIPSDHGCMLGWFANAIMAGYDAGIRKAREEERAEPERTCATCYHQMVGVGFTPCAQCAYLAGRPHWTPKPAEAERTCEPAELRDHGTVSAGFGDMTDHITWPAEPKPAQPMGYNARRDLDAWISQELEDILADERRLAVRRRGWEAFRALLVDGGGK